MGRLLLKEAPFIALEVLRHPSEKLHTKTRGWLNHAASKFFSHITLSHAYNILVGFVKKKVRLDEVD
jgi:hypothetical protein